MKKRQSSGKIIVGMVIFTILLFVVIYAFNRHLSSHLSEMEKTSQSDWVTSTKKEKHSENAKTITNSSKAIICKIRLDPSRKFYRHVFYQSNQEVAQIYIKDNGEILEKTGQIPDGKIEFVDMTKDTHGIQNYENEKRNGWLKEYNNKDALIKEEKYWNGRLLLKKEYYFDGVLKMETNYENARYEEIGGLKGQGKFYSPGGFLKFEWRYLSNEKLGYNKSYNRNGDLTKEEYFDENGNRLKSNPSSIGNP